MQGSSVRGGALSGRCVLPRWQRRSGATACRRSGVAARASAAGPSSPCGPSDDHEQHWPRPHVRQQADTHRRTCEPSETLRCFLERARGGNARALLEVLPDDVIDRALEQSRGSGGLDDLDIQDLVASSSSSSWCSTSSSTSSSSGGAVGGGCQGSLYLDTFALRNLLYSGPAAVKMLSGLHITSSKYLQRCAIVSPSGEECVLNFTMCLQDSLESQYRGPPLVTKKWMLSSVVGECSSDELPAHPSPSFPPEAVVEAQLQALREFKVASVFAHTSPESKSTMGPVERFAGLLHQHPACTPLLGHHGATTLQRLQPSETTYMEVVRVTPRPVAGVPQQPLLYMWFVSRQGEGSNWHGCWMTDAMQLLEAPPPSCSRDGDDDDDGSSTRSSSNNSRQGGPAGGTA